MEIVRFTYRHGSIKYMDRAVQSKIPDTEIDDCVGRVKFDLFDDELGLNPQTIKMALATAKRLRYILDELLFDEEVVKMSNDRTS